MESPITLQQIRDNLPLAMRRDRQRFQQMLRSIQRDLAARKPCDRRLGKLVEELDRSLAQRQARLSDVPQVEYDEDLPISAKRRLIADTIRRHPVVIVSGETGSGKSTQLPKICLELGRGIDGLIGHTQPRRIAARSVAARIADELHAPLGREVGFKVRFAEALGPHTYIKLMTDGILLAESQGDPQLDQYDTIILDEAHERSLNIDFLIGYLKRLLARRHDLKLIITSATIDSARFAQHFATAEGPAPVIEVSGRTYPVELRYRPIIADEGSDEIDPEQAVIDAVDELARTIRGDILIFMPTERDIHETSKLLRGHAIPGDGPGRTTEILPLYARLSFKEQQRVFQPHPHRRIVIATNVAESSLTVPGIRCVIDPGTARISRYSARTKTQRLPIEPVSRASADQRKGRCGRVAPGICIRLYSEDDYHTRDHFTAPEIQRTNLASVILQTKAFRLGDIETFPFLDPPKSEAIRDGYRTLFELGALDENRELTEIGRQLARLPVDPRIGRMILAAHDEGCLHEVLIIAAALEILDPRERPLEKQEAADACHVQFNHPESDFLGFLKLWDFYHHLKQSLSRNQVQKACRQNFLSVNRMREWTDIHRELLELVHEMEKGTGPVSRNEDRDRPPRQDAYDRIRRAILTGVLSNLATKGEGNEFTVAGGGKAHLWPGSGVFATKPKWVMAAEVVETTRRYLRTCARVNPRWIEPLAEHLVKRTYSDAQWDRGAASAMALERVSLFGLTIVAGRRVRYGPIDPVLSRQLLLQHGLVEGEFDRPPRFLTQNAKLLEEMEQLQAKLRRQDLLLGEWSRYEFYDRLVPDDVYDGPLLLKWLRQAERTKPGLLCFAKSDLVREEAADVPAESFPDAIPIQRMELPLDYQFEPGDESDGVTLTVPLEALNQLDPQRIGWLVPGLLEEKITALIRSLPKPLRRLFVPAPETARRVLGAIRFGEGDIQRTLAAALSREAGEVVPPNAFEEDRLPAELRMNVRVVDADGKTVAQGRDLESLRRQLGAEAAASFSATDDPQWTRDGLTDWDLDELPVEIEVHRGGLPLKAYPTLIDRQTTVSLRLTDSPERAELQTRAGLRRLFFLAARRKLESQAGWLPNLDKLLLYSATLRGFNLQQQAAELMADRAFVADQPAPRTRVEFEARLRAGQERILVAVQDVAMLVGPLFEAYHQARLAVDEATNPKWRHAVDDARSQLAHLVCDNFLTAIPWPWLQQYRRYFRALTERMAALTGGGLLREQKLLAEIEPRWQTYLERARQHQERDLYDPQLAAYRWMVEEYRVSLFAQKLGTAVPVSAKRLEQQWVKVRE